MTITASKLPSRLVQDLTDADFADFKELVARQTDKSQYPSCEDVVDRVVIFSAATLLPRLRGNEEERQGVMDDIQRALQYGPGVLVIRDMIPIEAIERASQVADELNPRPANLENKNSRRTFAYSEKHAKHDPDSFAEYYGNEIL